MKLFRVLSEEMGAEGTDLQGGGEQPSWYYSAPNEETQSAGVAGNGEVPDYFMVDKYKSIEEQAKAYPELAKRFGGFESAPETYELPEGVEADLLDNNMLDIVKEVGKEANMGQQTFNNLVSKVFEYQSQAQETALKNAMEQLGDNAEQRIQSVNNWLNTNAPKEMVEIIAPMGTSAEAIQALEWFIDQTKTAAPAMNNPTPQAKMSQQEYGEKLMAKDSSGQLKINTDPQYAAEMDELAKIYGKNWR